MLTIKKPVGQMSKNYQNQGLEFRVEGSESPYVLGVREGQFRQPLSLSLDFNDSLGGLLGFDLLHVCQKPDVATYIIPSLS